MRSITNTGAKHKGNAKGLIAILAIFVALCLICTAVLFMAKRDIIHINGLSPEQEVETIQVACLNAYATAGADVEGNVYWRTVELPSLEDAPLADDTIFAGTDLSDFVLRVDLMPNTVLTRSMLALREEDTSIDSSARYVNVDYITLNSSISVGDYIDVRLKQYSMSGTSSIDREEIVVAKKQVIAMNGSTVTLALNEDEIITLTAAAVEMTTVNNTSTAAAPQRADLYVTKYTNPSLQKAATVTYSNPSLIQLIKTNPNISVIPEHLEDINVVVPEIPVTPVESEGNE